MENKGCGRWRSRIPNSTCTSPSRLLRQGAVDKKKSLTVNDSEQERTGSKKTVTLAPVSRYMMDKSLYIMRKPLISSTCQIPILKNLSMHKDSEQISVDTSTETANIIPVTSKSLSESFPALSKEDLDASMTLSELRSFSHDENPILNTSFAKHTLSSPLSTSMSLTAPPVPKWTSSPRSSSQTSWHESHWTGKVKSRRSDSMDKPHLHNTRSSQYLGNKPAQRLKHMSPHQANYWACSIPASMPPSPNRKSPRWDPEREYQEVLDYTYPLTPNMTSLWGSSALDHLLRGDPMWKDSGIELDRICSSSLLSGLDLSPRGTQHGLHQSVHRSSSSLYSSIDQTGFSGEGVNCQSKQRGHRKCGSFSPLGSMPSFISSTRILRRPGYDDLDEEFLRLPEQLEELQVLSKQLRDISEQMSQPVTTNWESLESRIPPVRAPMLRYRTQNPLEENFSYKERDSVSDVPLTNKDHLDKLKESVSKIQMISNDGNRRSLKEVEAIVDQLSGLSVSEHLEELPTDHDETNASLVLRLKVFCSNLEELIEWLHKVVAKVEVLSPPRVDLDSVKASLADYKSFQEDVQAHKPLTADVLQTGQMLLHCLDSASPFLKDTLRLIERQSLTLETHSEYLFSSILSAMDCITDSRSEEVSEGIS